MSSDSSETGMSPFDAIFADGVLDPMVSAQKSMRADLPKRFWKTVTLEQDEGGYQVLLDGRPAKTPGRAALASPSPAIAERMRAEWDAVGERLDPAELPMTKLINVALDQGSDSREAIIKDITAYAGSDLVCYRAERPEGLVERQSTVWDPYVQRLSTHHSITMKLAAGIVHVDQEPETLAAIQALVDARAVDAESLVALHLATTLLGSAVLALALAEPGGCDGRAQAIWLASYVDEDWNRAQWGEDEEAKALRAKRWRDYEVAAFVLCSNPG
ncbi:MAG: ATP12 family chaperone protein [Hyphomicrobiales bacterium]